MNIAGEVLKYQNYSSIDDIPMNVVKLSFTNLKLRVLPNLSRFRHLRILYCSHNRLTRDNHTGNLIIHFILEFPASLSAEQIETLEKIL